jgi:hypothetical protein
MHVWINGKNFYNTNSVPNQLPLPHHTDGGASARHYSMVAEFCRFEPDLLVLVRWMLSVGELLLLLSLYLEL